MNKLKLFLFLFFHPFLSIYCMNGSNNFEQNNEAIIKEVKEKMHAHGKTVQSYFSENLEVQLEKALSAMEASWSDAQRRIVEKDEECEEEKKFFEEYEKKKDAKISPRLLLYLQEKLKSKNISVSSVIIKESNEQNSPFTVFTVGKKSKKYALQTNHNFKWPGYFDSLEFGMQKVIIDHEVQHIVRAKSGKKLLFFPQDLKLYKDYSWAKEYEADQLPALESLEKLHALKKFLQSDFSLFYAFPVNVVTSILAIENLFFLLSRRDCFSLGMNLISANFMILLSEIEHRTNSLSHPSNFHRYQALCKLEKYMKAEQFLLKQNKIYNDAFNRKIVGLKSLMQETNKSNTHIINEGHILQPVLL